MKLIAHRGKTSKKDIPNSLFSFQNALSKSYVYGIECDVRLTKDKKVVVLHDPIIDFVSDGSGIVKYMTLEEIKEYHFDGGLLTLDELLENIHSDKLIFIELKGEENNTDLVDMVNQILLRFQNLNIVVISFYYSLLKYIKKINREVKTGLLIGYFFNEHHIYNHFNYNLFSIHYLNEIFINKQIGYFTINQKKQLKEILNKRDDVIIITDEADSFQKLA